VSNMSKFILDQSASLRFQSLINYSIKALDVTQTNAYAISLLCFDAVVPQHLKDACDAKPYRTDDGVCISWVTKNGRTCRYLLSPMSQKIHAENAIHGNLKFDEDALQSLYQSLIFSRQSTGITLLINDQLSWLKEKTNGPLFAHLSEVTPIFGVPDSAFARLDCKQPLAKAQNVVEDPQENLALSEAIASCLESEGVDRSSIVYALKKACRSLLSRQQMLKECMELVPVAKNYGPISSILLAWAISLIKNPTRSNTLLAPGSISKYVSTISDAVYTHFKGEDVTKLDANAFASIYKEMHKSIVQLSHSTKKSFHSALTLFHYFLQDWFDAPSAGRPTFDGSHEHIPVANVIWPHEVKLILDWLSEASCDERLITMWQFSISLSSVKRIRIGELLDMRIGDIEILENALIIIHIRGQKTKASKRNIALEDPKLCEIIAMLIDRRRQEFAADVDFLLGDPHAPEKIYKLSQFYCGLQELLKAATGDRAATFHWMSHSVISFELKDILGVNQPSILNPYSQFSTDVAHFSIETSCSEYMHLHHIPLRALLNLALSNTKVTSEDVSRWVGMNATTIRKHISNHALNHQTYYWQLMMHYKVDLPNFRTMGALFETKQPELPAFLQNQQGLNFKKVFHVLADLVEDIPLPSVISRSGTTTDELTQIQLTLKNVLETFGLAKDLQLHRHASLAEVDLRILKSYGFEFCSGRKGKFDKVYQYFSKQKSANSTDLFKGINAWAILKGEHKNSYFGVFTKDHLEHFDPLLNLLKSVEIDLTKVAIFYSPTAEIAEMHLRLGEKFIVHFDRRPSFFKVEEHRGRPKIYMTFCDKQVISYTAPYSSSTSMGGFNAIFLAALVWVRCSK
jgi:integrase